MKTRLDRLRPTLLAALGLVPGCADRPGIGGSSGEGSGTGETGEGDASGDEADASGDEGDASGSGSDDEGEDGPPPPAYECEDPEPIFQAETDVPSGFVRCADGFVHRPEAVTCLAPQGPDGPICADGMLGCATGADCVDGPHPSCTEDPWGGCACHYGCANDADCAEGSICACAGVVSDRATCIPAECIVDDACGAGLCGLSRYEGCCSDSFETACADPHGECHVDADCGEDLCDPNWPEGGTVQHQCSSQSEFDPNKEGFGCEPPGWCGCDCGRAFFVDGHARTAPQVERDDWSLACDAALPSAGTRARLAAHWAGIGRFEHASVASFARFCLQLMQLGAPPELLVDAQRAMLDEIRHARIAFGLAGRFAGRPVGPGSLPIDAALAESTDARAIVESLIVEACVGETLAAVEVHEAALQARDPVVAGLLREIGEDELRHAQLGWRSLRWILDGGDAALRRFAFAVLDAAVRAVAEHDPLDGVARDLRPHGVLDDALRGEVRRKALESLVVPCAAGLRARYGLGPVSARA
jgi:hypothetical protein